MLISDLLSKTGRHKRRKRIGRGIGSGHGKTSGRGTKGMGAHSSDRAHRMNEGGQMPLFRRIPKRGFSNAQFRTEYQVVNIGTLEERFEAGTRVTPQALAQLGLIHDAEAPVKILGTGEITKKLEIEATTFSLSASQKITKAGGKFIAVIPPAVPAPKPEPKPGVGKLKKEAPAGEAGEGKEEGKKAKAEKGEKAEKKEKKEKAPKKEKKGGAGEKS
jgi:large subunit ribosomal protein L15